jgi:hypothetical protein
MGVLRNIYITTQFICFGTQQEHTHTHTLTLKNANMKDSDMYILYYSTVLKFIREKFLSQITWNPLCPGVKLHVCMLQDV